MSEKYPQYKIVEVANEKAEAVRAAIVAAGGKVLA